jgi:hypothetical protein
MPRLERPHRGLCAELRRHHDEQSVGLPGYTREMTIYSSLKQAEAAGLAEFLDGARRWRHLPDVHELRGRYARSKLDRIYARLSLPCNEYSAAGPGPSNERAFQAADRIAPSNKPGRPLVCVLHIPARPARKHATHLCQRPTETRESVTEHRR